MSIIVTTQPTVTLSAIARKAFTAINPAKVVSDLIANASDKSSLVPSDIRMTTIAARTMMGVKMTPQSFTQGLCFVLLKVAHGAKYETLTDGMPAGSVTAVSAACGTFKRGAGISALQLEHAVQTGFHALLALPAPESKKKVESLPSAGTTTGTPTETKPENMAPHWSELTGFINKDADSGPAEESANRLFDMLMTDQTAAAERAAAERAEGAAKFERDAETSAAHLVSDVLKRRDAEAIARTLAESLGFRLVRIPAKKSA